MGAVAGEPGCDQLRPFSRTDAGPRGRTDHAAQRVGRFAGVCGGQHPAKRQRLVVQPSAGLRAQRRFAHCFGGFRPQQPGQGGGAAAKHPGTFQGRGQTSDQCVLAQVSAGALPQHLGQHFIGHYVVRGREVARVWLQPAQIAQAAQGQGCCAGAVAACGLAGGGACSLHFAGFQRRGSQHRGGRDQRGLGLRWQETTAARHHQAIFGQAFAQPAHQVAPAQTGEIDHGQRVVPCPALQLFGDQHRDNGAFAAQFADTLAPQLCDRHRCDPVQCAFRDLGGLALAGFEHDLFGEQRIAPGVRRAQRRRAQIAQQRQTQSALVCLR